MSVALRAWRVAELVALRLTLPTRLSREPLDALLASLTPPHRPSDGAREFMLSAGDFALAERGVARLPWVISTCLYRALSRYALLRKAGTGAQFVMGVDRRGLDESGHAWVELDGLPFAEPDDLSRYSVTYRYPPASAGKELP